MDVTQAILGTYLLPFFIALMGILLLNEKITYLMFFGGMLILLSTLMVTIYENPVCLLFLKKKNPFKLKITNVQAIGLKLPEISSAADGTQDDLIIIVETDEGITGYGEVDTAPGVGKAIVDAYMSHGTCYGLREVVVGCRSLRL